MSKKNNKEPRHVLPETLKVLGYIYTVFKRTDREGFGDMGHCRPERLSLDILEHLDPQQSRSTLLHEILHALDHHLQMNLDESQVRQLETGLMTLLLDNGVDLSPLLGEIE